MILTLLRTIPGGSRAPYSPTEGFHWPAGQMFRIPEKRLQRAAERLYGVPPDRTLVEQVGGDEVLVLIPNSQFDSLFGVTKCHEEML